MIGRAHGTPSQGAVLNKRFLALNLTYLPHCAIVHCPHEARVKGEITRALLPSFAKGDTCRKVSIYAPSGHFS